MNHDPGCFLPERMDWPCICDRLRACEERVRAEYGSLRTMHACADRARANGIKAAREAVAAVVTRSGWLGYSPEHVQREALAAIDALMEDG